MAASGLVDLLELPLQRRGECLRGTWPHPLDSSLTEHNGVKWTEKDKATVDIAVLIVRAINSQCDPLDSSLLTDGDTAGQRRNTEKKTLLLRYSWYNPSGGVTEDVLKLQRQLCEKVLAGQPNFTFERLIGLGVMARSFWSRKELVAWSLEERIREEGAERWTQQKISSIPAMKGQAEVKGSDGDAAILEQLAYRSLVLWKWDGETQLAEFLMSKVKLEWSSADGRAHQGIRTWPSCLRVRLDPAGRDDAPRFTDLVRINLGKSVNYRLLATVKLGGEGRRDFVRVYDSDCRDARPMATQGRPLPYIDNEWELGQPGSRYMLYYLECGPEWAPSLPPKEVIVFSSRQVDVQRQINAMREAARVEGPPPLPYGNLRLTNAGWAHSDWEDENGEGSAYGGADKGQTGTPSVSQTSSSETPGEDPRAKTLQRVKEMGGNVDEYYSLD